jgi:hypothetical protein
MSEYTIELLTRPFSGPSPGSGIINREVAEFADKGEAVQRAKDLYKAHEARAIGWRVLNSVGKLVGIGLDGTHYRRPPHAW